LRITSRFFSEAEMERRGRGEDGSAAGDGREGKGATRRVGEISG
jgi:hypothetical protein